MSRRSSFDSDHYLTIRSMESVYTQQRTANKRRDTPFISPRILPATIPEELGHGGDRTSMYSSSSMEEELANTHDFMAMYQHMDRRRGIEHPHAAHETKDDHVMFDIDPPSPITATATATATNHGLPPIPIQTASGSSWLRQHLGAHSMCYCVYCHLITHPPVTISTNNPSSSSVIR